MMKIHFEQDVIHFLEIAWIPILEVVAGVLIGPRVKRMIVKLADKSQDKGLMTFLGSTANILIILLSMIMAAEALGIKMSSIVSLISALGLGIALALKGNMANVAGGLQILITKPFKIGDYIKVTTHRGYVTTIELMFTTIRTDNQKEVVIPNATIVEDMITNYSKYPFVRLKVPFSVPYGQDIPTIRLKALELLKENPLLLKDQPMEVTIKSITGGYVTFEAIGHVSVANHERARMMLFEKLATTIPSFLPQPATIEEVEMVSSNSAANSSSSESDSTQENGTGSDQNGQTDQPDNPSAQTSSTSGQNDSSSNEASEAASIADSAAAEAADVPLVTEPLSVPIVPLKEAKAVEGQTPIQAVNKNPTPHTLLVENPAFPDPVLVKNPASPEDQKSDENDSAAKNRSGSDPETQAENPVKPDPSE